MLVDLNKLSAKELFELAQQKEHEEESELNELREQTEDLKARRHSLILTHQEKIVGLNQQIEALSIQRKELMEKNATELDSLDSQIRQIQERYQHLTETKDAQSDATAALLDAVAIMEPEEEPAPTTHDDRSRVVQAVYSAMKGRLYISDGLLKEKLVLQGFKRQDVIDTINRLLKDKSIVRKGGNNYSMA